MPIAAADISSADRTGVRRPRLRSHLWSLGPESAALFVIGGPLAWLTWRTAGVDPTDQAVVFGWVLGCAALASVALRNDTRFALPWPAVPIALMPIVQLLPLGDGANLNEVYALFAAHGVPRPDQISVYPYATIQACSVLGGCCALFAIARALASHSTRAFFVVGLSLLSIGLVQAVLGLQQHLASQAMEVATSHFARGTFINRDHYAALMEGCFGLALGFVLAMTAGRNWKRWLASRESSLVVGALLVAGIFGMSVVFSYSRMGVLVLGVMCVAALALTLFHNRRATVLLGLAGGTAALVVAAAGLRGLSERFAELIAQHGDPSRLATWQDTLRIIPDFAWTGSGLGTFAFVFRRSEAYLPLKTIDHAHSDYLELLVELGLPGSALLFGAVGFVFVHTLWKAWATHNTRVRSMAFGCLLGAGGIFLHATADFPLRIPAIAAMTAVLLGSASGLATSSRSPGWLARGVSGVVCAGLCVASIILLQGHWSVRDAQALSQRAHAAAMQGVADEAESGYVAALSENPFAAAAWLARAELAETTGDGERALDMLKLARTLEPFTLRTEWALANAYLRRDNVDAAVRPFGLLAAAIPEMRVGLLEAAWTGGITAADVAAKIVPPQGEAAGEFLNYLVRKKAWEELPSAYAAFDEAAKRSIPVDLMRYTFDQAFAAGETGAYLDLWKKTSREVANAGGPLTIEHNGTPETFGLDGYGLQWAVRPHRGVATRSLTSDREPTSIEITFVAPQNLHYSHVSRDFAALPSRRYVLHAEIQVDEITSSQGIRLLVTAPGGSLVESQPVHGTTDWSKVRLPFRAGATDRVLRFYIVRYPSTTFDHDIAGHFRLRNMRVVVE